MKLDERVRTRPGQVYGSWSESDESANQMYARNERSVSKIKPAPGIIYMENEIDCTCPRA
jgi:hypothetical protein